MTRNQLSNIIAAAAIAFVLVVSANSARPPQEPTFTATTYEVTQ